MSTRREKLEAAIWISGLMKASSLGSIFISGLLKRYSDLPELYHENEKVLIETIDGPPDKVLKALSYIRNNNFRKKANEDSVLFSSLYFENCVDVLSVTDTEYPRKLLQISSPPPILYVCSIEGLEKLNNSYSVAVVGTRNPTQYGISVTEKLISDLKGTQLNIISGLARGIDSIAHETSLCTGIYTVAVIGCGLDVIYPPENKELMTRIIERGAVISECPPHTLPIKSYFPARNRIISGISDCIIITEASIKSGTMITAGFAGDQGRDVYAIPGSVFSPQSTGTNRLIKDGASVLTSAQDLIDNCIELKFRYYNSIFKIGDTASTGRLEVESHNRITDSILGNDSEPDAETLQNMQLISNIHKLLNNMELTIDEIAVKLGKGVEDIAQLISVEELSGRVVAKNGRFILT